MTKQEALLNTSNFLYEMLEYYTKNPDERRSAKGPHCSYYPSHAKTEGCAIGRHLNEEDARIYDMNGWSTEEVIKNNVQFNNLHEEFLKSVQTLHDNEKLWNETGLSAIGKIYVESLIVGNNLDKRIFLKFL